MRKIEIRVAVLALMLAGCGAPQHEERHTQYAQTARIDAARALTMEQQCRGSAARQYNTQPPQIEIQGLEAFQGSYEVRGVTRSREQFTCTFEPDGQFLHLSMR